MQLGTIHIGVWENGGNYRYAVGRSSGCVILGLWHCFRSPARIGTVVRRCSVDRQHGYHSQACIATARRFRCVLVREHARNMCDHVANARQPSLACCAAHVALVFCCACVFVFGPNPHWFECIPALLACLVHDRRRILGQSHCAKRRGAASLRVPCWLLGWPSCVAQHIWVGYSGAPGLHQVLLFGQR